MSSNTDERPLMVSIKCMVYNHAPYLRQCLDGFIMQKTNFRFEAMVHDDASTDNSADIIREYAQKYPDIIKPVIEKENVYSKDIIRLRRITNEMCTGKYVAHCEGDDFWTDPYKLQKQVDYMEAHPGCSLCFSAARILCEKGIPDSDSLVFEQQKTRDWYGTEITKQWSVATASILHINDMHDYPYDPRFIYGDGPLLLFMLQKGYLHCIGEQMVTYRRNASSVSYQTRNIPRIITHYEAIKEVFGKKYHYADRKIVELYMKLFRMGGLGKESWKALFSILKKPRYTLLFLRFLPKAILRPKKNDSKRVQYKIK
ncbi:MAG: glycosyltransferase family 2 protein [Bacteroidaceae bacterium]|nr:glycosyltransferase family 2 protein [Bacteroidaceae bacterium]